MGAYWIGSSPSASSMNVTGWNTVGSIFQSFGVMAISIPFVLGIILLGTALTWIVKNKLSEMI